MTQGGVSYTSERGRGDGRVGWRVTNPRRGVRDCKSRTNGKGVAKSVPVVIQNVVAGDLSGDGREEVLIEGTYHSPSSTPAKDDTPGKLSGPYYSFVGLWRVNGSRLSRIWDRGDYALVSPDGAYQQHDLAGVLDIDADGAMEFIIWTYEHLPALGYYDVCEVYRLSRCRVKDLWSACWGE